MSRLRPTQNATTRVMLKLRSPLVRRNAVLVGDDWEAPVRVWRLQKPWHRPRPKPAMPRYVDMGDLILLSDEPSKLVEFVASLRDSQPLHEWHTDALVNLDDDGFTRWDAVGWNEIH